MPANRSDLPPNSNTILNNPPIPANLGVQQQQPQAFSWLDLDATWNFATQNGGDDIMAMDGIGIDSMDGFGETSPFDRGGYMPDLSFLEGASEGLPF